LLFIRPFVHCRLVKIFICIFWRVNQLIAGAVCAVKHIVVVIWFLAFVVITDVFEVIDSRIIDDNRFQMRFIDSVIFRFFDFSIGFIKLVINVRIVIFYCLSIWSWFIFIRNVFFFHFNSLLYFLGNPNMGWIISVN